MELHIAPSRVCTSLRGRSPARKKVARPPKVRPGVTVSLVVAITLRDTLVNLPPYSYTFYNNEPERTAATETRRHG